jgi:hypothetical protein
MNVVCGIYGYQITRPIDLRGGRIEPRTSEHNQARQWARNADTYELTAVLKGASMLNDFLFNIEAVLSFIERLDVLITLPVEYDNDDAFSQFPPSIRMHRRRFSGGGGRLSGGGAVIGDDTFFGASRSAFILKAIDRLEDNQEAQFKILFFKCVESFRQPFLEVEYFLLYSGLESYAKSYLKQRKRNNNEPIYTFLRDYKFGVERKVNKDKMADPKTMDEEIKRSIPTYERLRGAIFHNSKVKDIAMHGTKVNVADYLFNISQLVALVILKVVEFDDGHINWDSWIDRQPFK